jgi:sugar fermentation stimulation protein A
MNQILFKDKLKEGIILSRPNRFIMNIQINSSEYKSHCPSTGRISSLNWKDIPCLVSENNNPERKTRFTVEAFSLDSIEKKKKLWIGINQNKANRYIEFFLKENNLANIAKVKYLKREVTLGNSKIDFLGNETDYIEVKTPLQYIPCHSHSECRENKTPVLSFDRLIKHFGDITKHLKQGQNAHLVMCYMYDAPRFIVPKDNANPKIVAAARSAVKKGLMNWQVNLKIDEKGIELIRYFPLELF